MLAREQALDAPTDRQLERAQEPVGHRPGPGTLGVGLADDAQRRAPGEAAAVSA